MTREELEDRYLHWMYRLVNNDKYAKRNAHHKLFRYLHSVEFTYTMDMDGNRYEDGIGLRYRFALDEGIDDSIVATYLDDEPCSVLEMMIALALRCEENIMDDPAMGTRIGQWFWTMVTSLGLGQMTDSRFNQRYAEQVVAIFLNRDYDYNGRGGLFTVEHPQRDMRDVEIWYQMNWYLNEII